MLSILANRTYRHLFLAQIIALVGTGLATVALGLLAYDIAGANGGAVLGTAMAIKMIAYIGVAPVVGAYANRLPRRAFLVAMDVVRGLVALALPFVDQVWQVYLLIFVLQSASAGFTPTFQATIPDVLPEEKDYTRALSLSRLAYDMESLTSPMLAAALLTVMNFHWLFTGTAVGFACSALLVLSVVLPRSAEPARSGGIYDRTTRGTRLYLKTPRLRGLLAVTLAAAAASAMVIVNTPVLVQASLGRGQSEVAITLAAFGGGSMLAALLLPRLLDRVSDRSVMLAAAAVLTVALGVLALSWGGHSAPDYWSFLLAGWLVLGIAYSASVTPGGRLLRRSSDAADRPALFAAQFALSHVCWLIAYPLAGQLGARAGMGVAFGAAAVLALAGTAIAFFLWPAEDSEVVPHTHDDLPPDHPHLTEEHSGGNATHAFVIDDLHTRWPK
ncbi:MFS transporter [Sphingomonas koreensis]|uniref:MFS transporter n=1 Tax=Sphingomonas koreensis TaxID=93064 RepID=UPI00234F23EE|nr:MFS transporter [Sphingomonas koreensis]MDC7810915.1 MFS transporter [Sphingomonas koreensis]